MELDNVIRNLQTSLWDKLGAAIKQDDNKTDGVSDNLLAAMTRWELTSRVRRSLSQPEFNMDS